ncbi:Golgi membrane exchange factor (Ric1p-Rgp1p) subunit [Hypoxylon texense]
MAKVKGISLRAKAPEVAQQKPQDDATSDQPSDGVRTDDFLTTDLDQTGREGVFFSKELPSIYEMEELEHIVFGEKKGKRPRYRGGRLFKKVERVGSREKAKTNKATEKGKGESWTAPTKKEEWQVQKSALQQKFPTGWSPRKRLSPDALDGIRALHAQFPEDYTTEVLAAKFEVSPEAIRRILRSRWTPRPEEEEDRQARWFNRGKNIWSHMAALGRKPPRRWRKEGIVRDPVWNEPRGPRTQPPRQRQRQSQRYDESED